MDIAEIKSALDERDSAIAAKLQSVEKENDALRDRLEELEVKASSGGNGETREQVEHKQVFTDWLRKPNDVGRTQALENCEAHMQRKASQVVIGTPSAGGFAVPEVLLREIEKLEKKFSPVPDLVNVVRVGTGDMRALVNIRGATAGWVSETGTRTATLTSELREIAPTGGELYALPKATEWALDDIFFDVAAWLAQEVAESFAVLEGDAVIRGDGSTKPTGMLNGPPHGEG